MRKVNKIKKSSIAKATESCRELERSMSELERQITERQHAEEALHQSEAKYRSIFENAVEGIFQSTPDSQLIAVNPAMARIFGFASPEEMVREVTNIGRQLYINYENRNRFEKLLAEHGTVRGFESQFYRKDGSALWGSLNVRAVRDEAGNILYYEGMLEDITARKRAEEDLKKSEEKYRNIFDNASEGIFQVTPDGRYLSVNPTLAKIHGYDSPEEMVLTVTDIAHQLYVDPSRRAELRRLLEEKGFVKDFEIMMRKKDRGLQWVSVTSHTVKDANGGILYYEGMLQDITARKFAAEELGNLRKSLAGLLSAMSSMIEMRDPGITGHQKRVSEIASAIADEMGLAHDTIEHIRVAGIIHDVGKISVPAEILSKPAGLTEMEYGLVKTHPQAGYDMLKDAGLPHPVAEMVLQHHERLDGSGYPRGLKGPDILLEARILAVADVAEAIVSPRPYRPARSQDAAVDEITRNKGILYDPEAADIFVRLFRDKNSRSGYAMIMRGR
ncbi:MAG: PAS domain S-box protein [Syntrophorhabdaceae bacterium]|nr:PAS domain S-box protein [Syntrophorhabdaceae bacterium]